MPIDTTGRLLLQRPTAQRPRFASLRVLTALILREMTTTYGRSPGGYVWAILEPVAGITLLTLVFSAGFQSPPLGTNFAIFYATGIIPFLLYLDVSNKLSQALQFSKQLLVYPTITYFDALMARFVLNFMTQILISYIVFTGIILAFDTRTGLDPVGILTAFAMVGMLALGVGTANCFLSSMFPVWIKVWSILNRPLFIISCLFFTFESVPQPYQDYLWFNPLVHVVGQMRASFYPYYDASYVSPTYVFGISGFLTMAGLLFVGRYYRDILNA